MFNNYIKKISILCITLCHTASTLPMMRPTDRASVKHVIKYNSQKYTRLVRIKDPNGGPETVVVVVGVIGGALSLPATLATGAVLVVANVVTKVATGNSLVDHATSSMRDTPLPTEQREMNRICAEKSNPWNLDAHDLKVMKNFPKDEYENPIYKVVQINPARSKDKSECYRFVADHEKATRLNQERCEARQKYLESLPFFGEPSIIINQDNKKPPFQTLTTIPEENNSINVSHARADGENPLKNPAFKPKKAKGNPKPVKQPHPETGQWGYEDEKGLWWVPTGNNGSQHGGKHWDVVDKHGNHENVSPEGFIMGTNIPFKCEMPLGKEEGKAQQIAVGISFINKVVDQPKETRTQFYQRMYTQMPEHSQFNDMNYYLDDRHSSSRDSNSGFSSHEGHYSGTSGAPEPLFVGCDLNESYRNFYGKSDKSEM